MSELTSKLDLAFKAVYDTKTDHRGYLECPFCYKAFKALKSHIIARHNIPLSDLDSMDLDLDSQILIDSENYFHKQFDFRNKNGQKIK
jgi:hypothetical protein